MKTEHRTHYQIRAAKESDIEDILELFTDEVKAGRMLPRTYENVREHLHNWQVGVCGQEIIGCVSLEMYNPFLCEVRSLAVSTSYRKNGLGKMLVQAAVKLAEEREVYQVLALTRAPVLFEHVGFEVDKIENFPEKVQKDCLPCPFIDCCDEIALVMETHIQEVK